MKIRMLQQVVEESSKRLSLDEIADLVERVRRGVPPDFASPKRMAMRRSRLQESDVQPSPTALERILGTNDLVDVNFLERARDAASAVCRVVLRDESGREVGYGTGSKIAPDVLMTNRHVLPNSMVARRSLAEFDYELDVAGNPIPRTRFPLDISFFFEDSELDLALVGISSEAMFGEHSLGHFGVLRLVGEVGKINEGESITIVQHPGGSPKQIALRENDLLKIQPLVLWYQSDTAKGSSGSPLFNDSFQVVGLHRAGVPRKDEQGQWLTRGGVPAGPDTDDSEIDWIANEGTRASKIVAFVEDLPASERRDAILSPTRDLEQADPDSSIDAPRSRDTSPGSSRAFRESGGVGNRVRVEARTGGGAIVSVPEGAVIEIKDAPRAASLHPDAATGRVAEALRMPFIDRNYGRRRGYNPDFLGIELPLPTVTNRRRVAKMEDGGHEIPYQHFSVVMHKKRRLALFTASNVDARRHRRRPEDGRDYTRDGLGGLRDGDSEKWSTDPRISDHHQLPDVFFTRDRQSFDKGHLVRREDVAWGSSYEQVRRANGDTFHTTNCCPQTKDFNRSGAWRQLERLVLREAKDEKLCVFSGPLLRSRDRRFYGVDDDGETVVKIPSIYWKVVVSRRDEGLRAYAFYMRQRLNRVRFEVDVSSEWDEFLITIAELEEWIGLLRFPVALHRADQVEAGGVDELVSTSELAGIRRGYGE